MTGRTRSGRRGSAATGTFDDRGSASVLVVGAIGALVLLLAGAMALLSAVAASHRARAAADLAALAAAGARVDGGDARDPCAVASEVAERNGSALAACAVAGDDVTVTVRTPVSWPGLGAASARARAGPDPLPSVRAGR